MSVDLCKCLQVRCALFPHFFLSCSWAFVIIYDERTSSLVSSLSIAKWFFCHQWQYIRMAKHLNIETIFSKDEVLLFVERSEIIKKKLGEFGISIELPASTWVSGIL